MQVSKFIYLKQCSRKKKLLWKISQICSDVMKHKIFMVYQTIP